MKTYKGKEIMLASSQPLESKNQSLKKVLWYSLPTENIKQPRAALAPVAKRGTEAEHPSTSHH